MTATLSKSRNVKWVDLPTDGLALPLRRASVLLTANTSVATFATTPSTEAQDARADMLALPKRRRTPHMAQAHDPQRRSLSILQGPAARARAEPCGRLSLGWRWPLPPSRRGRAIALHRALKRGARRAGARTRSGSGAAAREAGAVARRGRDMTPLQMVTVCRPIHFIIVPLSSCFNHSRSVSPEGPECCMACCICRNRPGLTKDALNSVEIAPQAGNTRPSQA